MHAAGSPALRRAAVWALLATLFVVFLSLAAWQVQRRSWKLALIERVEQRAHGQPQPNDHLRHEQRHRQRGLRQQRQREWFVQVLYEWVKQHEIG